MPALVPFGLTPGLATGMEVAGLKSPSRIKALPMPPVINLRLVPCDWLMYTPPPAPPAKATYTRCRFPVDTLAVFGAKITSVAEFVSTVGSDKSFQWLPESWLNHRPPLVLPEVALM